MKILYAIAILFFLCDTSYAQFSIFGPKDYDECIIDSMKGVTSKAAVNNIRKSCRNKFPIEKEDRSHIDWSQVDGKGYVQEIAYDTNYVFNMDIYNGSIDQITSIHIEIKGSINGNKTTKDYIVECMIAPKNKGTCFAVIYWNKDMKFEGWNILNY